MQGQGSPKLPPGPASRKRRGPGCGRPARLPVIRDTGAAASLPRLEAMNATESRPRAPSRTAPARPAVRVLLACDHVGFDDRLHGSGRIMVELARAFDPTRVALHACVLQPGGALGEALRAEGVPLEFLGRGRFDVRVLGDLVRRIRRERIQVLHVWDFGASTFGRLAGLLTGTPVVVHVHSHHSRFQRRGFPRYVRAAYRLLAPRTARAIAISASIRSFAQDEMGFTERQIVTVNNPAGRDAGRAADPAAVAAVRREHGIPDGVPVIGSVTRLFEVKGIGFLLDAMPAVLAAVPEARLLLVGDGPLREALEGQARRLGVAHRVIFAGFRRDVEAHLGAFTITAMPSLEEGMPMAAIESVMAGVPLVASREGGLLEVVTDGRTGLLVPPGDAEALGDALVRVLTEPGLRDRLAAACREERARFSLDGYTERLERLYREVAAAG